MSQTGSGIKKAENSPKLGLEDCVPAKTGPQKIMWSKASYRIPNNKGLRFNKFIMAELFPFCLVNKCIGCTTMVAAGADKDLDTGDEQFNADSDGNEQAK